MLLPPHPLPPHNAIHVCMVITKWVRLIDLLLRLLVRLFPRFGYSGTLPSQPRKLNYTIQVNSMGNVSEWCGLRFLFVSTFVGYVCGLRFLFVSTFVGYGFCLFRPPHRHVLYPLLPHAARPTRTFSSRVSSCACRSSTPEGGPTAPYVHAARGAVSGRPQLRRGMRTYIRCPLLPPSSPLPRPSPSDMSQTGPTV